MRDRFNSYFLFICPFILQANEERNYHIFYQMCAASKKLQHLRLGFQDQFQYLNQGNSPLIEGVDDLEGFDDTMSALAILGFTQQQRDDALHILAAILHLGNVDIKSTEKNSEDCFISVKENGFSFI